VFYLLGVQLSLGDTSTPGWAKRLFLTFVLVSLFLIAPLGDRLLSQALQGQARPLVYPASKEIREDVYEYLTDEPGLEIIMMGRSGVDPELGLHILVACEGVVPPTMKEDLESIVHDILGEETPVRILALNKAPETAQAGKELESRQ
jgi:hypothetical protein